MAPKGPTDSKQEDKTTGLELTPSGKVHQGARTLILHPDTVDPGSLRSPGQNLEEAIGLAEAIDLDIIEARIQRVRRISPKTFIGGGIVEELRALGEEKEIALLIFNGALSPIQQRNLERALKMKVIDRTGLILEIFGERAQTREGVLQVELAHLEYQKGRLVRSWTHLERQRGGVGFLGGPGERQIESDRRQLQERITQIKSRLKDVQRTRELHRKQRRDAPFPIVALVGYTNAGKSTLFNRMTKADVMAEDMLFATLDPTMRAVELPGGRKIILSDTVGFISDLPTELVAAFRATLEEVLEADLILHVRDMASSVTDIERVDVLKVLAELGVDSPKTPILEVWNKIDLLDHPLKKQESGGVALSAWTGEGVDALLKRIESILGKDEKEYEIRVPYSEGRMLAWLHAHGRILKQVKLEEGYCLSVKLSEKAVGQFKSEFSENKIKSVE